MAAAVGIAVEGGEGVEAGEAAAAGAANREPTAAHLHPEIHEPPQRTGGCGEGQFQLQLLEGVISGRDDELILVDVSALGE